MRLNKLEQQMFDESYGRRSTYYPTYADLCYISDLNFRLTRSRNWGARRCYEQRTSRGRAMVHRNWVRRFPKLFTREVRQAVNA